jgi:hypothetical protein
MNDDLREHLDRWQVPAVPERTGRRIAALLDDSTLPGPLVAGRRRGRALPVVFAAAVATLVVLMAPRPAPSLLGHRVVVTADLVETPRGSAPSRSAALAVSSIDLDGFELVAHPRMRVHRRTP